MSKYIDADKFLKSLQERYESALSWHDNVSDSELKIKSEQAIATFLECILTLKAQPTTDVGEVRHGEWINCGSVWEGADEYEIWRCSNCSIPNYKKTRYCPACGVKMARRKKNERFTTCLYGMYSIYCC